MGKRTSPNAIQDANDLSQLGNIVQDKRNGKRSGAKKGCVAIALYGETKRRWA